MRPIERESELIPERQMTIEEADLQSKIGEWLSRFPDGSPVVAVPIYNAYDEVVLCLDSLLATTPAGMPLLLVDDASTDQRLPDHLSRLDGEQNVKVIRQPVNRGFVGTVNSVFNAAAAANRELTPGIISYSIPFSSSTAICSRVAPYIPGSPLCKRATSFPCSTASIIIPVISSKQSEALG